jgi:hypothetical protein
MIEYACLFILIFENHYRPRPGPLERLQGISLTRKLSFTQQLRTKQFLDNSRPGQILEHQKFIELLNQFNGQLDTQDAQAGTLTLTTLTFCGSHGKASDRTARKALRAKQIKSYSSVGIFHLTILSYRDMTRLFHADLPTASTLLK